ncbi:hypothetical protein GN958_ATG03576 [Phytophthora infestans]|uniref:Uncharacterized protein n=1 Tax=Phytophthora infestans TaxID=4787 RepID=A0A8S9V141_PHYIN|nr:hypothetical protein GN958_ATG03576 [Phytophthora infestans]
MFLELSFASSTEDKKMSASKALRSWQNDYEDKDEMSLDELISDFQQSATRSRSRLSQSKRSSNAPSQSKTPPSKNSKAKADTNRQRALRPQSTKIKATSPTFKTMKRDDSSDDEAAVSPMPRIEHVLRNRPSFASKRCSACSSVSTQAKPTRSTQMRKRQDKSPVLSSPSLTPPSLSPVTSSSTTSSPLSVSNDIYTSGTPDEDSIDALIGKEIRDLNDLISTGSRVKAKSSATDDVSNVIRQSTRFGKTSPKNLRSSLRLRIPRERKIRASTPESPPPPPPPEDSEDDEEDSFAEEIRKLRESRRLSSMATKTAEKESEKEESSDFCSVTALRVRNASNTISELLLEALKPFEGKVGADEEAKTLKEETSKGDAAIRDAASAELQCATQTIVSQLDLTFADMTERRKADLKADEDAAAAAKDAEKREKEAAEEKKKTEENEAKESEMEILRLIPMQGKLLTCSTDIENVLQQLDSADISHNELKVDAEIRALRSVTERRIQEIEARMTATAASNQEPGVGISWRNVDWVQDNLKVDPVQDNVSLSEEPEDPTVNVESSETESSFEEVLQRQVLEKLDLTMLKLRHVLAIDTKEADEMKETQQREQAEQEQQQAQQQEENEQKQRATEDAETARRRVMGLSSLDDVEGWLDEGRRLQDRLWHNQSLSRLMATMENRTEIEDGDETCYNNMTQTETEGRFDRRMGPLGRQVPSLNVDKGSVRQRNYPERGWERPERHPISTKRVQEVNTRGWIQVANCSSDSEVEDGSGSESDGQRMDHRKSGSPSMSCPSPGLIKSSHKTRAPVKESKYPRNDRLPSKMQQNRRRRVARDIQHEVTRTIQALQVERRRKATWIRSRLCSPSRPAF